MPCGGNASQTCGGDRPNGKFANNVYLTSLSKYFITFKLSFLEQIL